jgi:hypothetical protein
MIEPQDQADQERDDVQDMDQEQRYCNRDRPIATSLEAKQNTYPRTRSRFFIILDMLNWWFVSKISCTYDVPVILLLGFHSDLRETVAQISGVLIVWYYPSCNSFMYAQWNLKFSIKLPSYVVCTRSVDFYARGYTLKKYGFWFRDQ